MVNLISLITILRLGVQGQGIYADGDEDAEFIEGIAMT
jgi:hypothetical protein